MEIFLSPTSTIIIKKNFIKREQLKKKEREREMLLIKTKIACDKIVIYFTQSLLCARHFAEHFVHISHLIFTTNLRSMYNGHHFIAGKLIHTHLVNCD